MIVFPCGTSHLPFRQIRLTVICSIKSRFINFWPAYLWFLTVTSNKPFLVSVKILKIEGDSIRALNTEVWTLKILYISIFSLTNFLIVSGFGLSWLAITLWTPCSFAKRAILRFKSSSINPATKISQSKTPAFSKHASSIEMRVRLSRPWRRLRAIWKLTLAMEKC